jgi:hypothetical protein
MQGLGVGTALMRAGLEELRRRGIAVVVVLGHRTTIHASIRGGVFARIDLQVAGRWRGVHGAELVAGALGKIGGRVEYDAAFDVFLIAEPPHGKKQHVSAMLMLLNGCVFGYCCKIGRRQSQDEVPKGGTFDYPSRFSRISSHLNSTYASDRLIKTLRETHLFTSS